MRVDYARAPARAVVQGRRRLRRRPRVPLGLLQQLRDPADADRRARRRVARPRTAWDAFREPVLQRARRYAAIQERLISPEGAFPADRPLAGVPVRRVPVARADRTDAPVAGRGVSGTGPLRPHRGDPAHHRGARAPSIAMAGSRSGSAATSRRSARPTSRPAASTCARPACCRSACRRPTSSGRRRRGLDGEEGLGRSGRHGRSRAEVVRAGRDPEPEQTADHRERGGQVQRVLPPDGRRQHGRQRR